MPVRWEWQIVVNLGLIATDLKTKKSLDGLESEVPQDAPHIPIIIALFSPPCNPIITRHPRSFEASSIAMQWYYFFLL